MSTSLRSASRKAEDVCRPQAARAPSQGQAQTRCVALELAAVPLDNPVNEAALGLKCPSRGKYPLLLRVTLSASPTLRRASKLRHRAHPAHHLETLLSVHLPASRTRRCASKLRHK